MTGRRPCGRSATAESVSAAGEPLAMKVADAAQRIGCSEGQLRKMINRGEGPAFVMIGQIMMIKRATLEKWLTKREAESQKVLKRNLTLARKFSPAESTGGSRK